MIINDLKNKKESIWLNENLESLQPRQAIGGYGFVYMKAAQNRFMRFLPYIASAFPETAAKKGIIESSLIPIPHMKEAMEKAGCKIQGKVFLKDDARLPIAGSVKARGGIHEVLRIAESLAQKNAMLHPNDNYGKIDSEEFRQFYSQYTIQVGSTGNLGLSIGIMAAKLGFRVIVHMSADAKEWKKRLLREKGVTVKEYAGDYSQAVKKGREESALDEKSFFVDDENSLDLFFGYSTAGMRVKVQLFKAGVVVDEQHPLFVYLPCGVGGAPGGIAFGLKQMYGDAVHCFFAEPVEAPCMLLGLASGKHEEISVQDFGLSGQTIADGLAVGRPSPFVSTMMKEMISGGFTVEDDRLLQDQKLLMESEGLFLEASACAGFRGLASVEEEGNAFSEYIRKHNLTAYMDQATHVVWGTGGGLMPEEEREKVLSGSQNI